MVSVFIVSLPSVGVGVEAMRLVEPVVRKLINTDCWLMLIN
jgi:hypothetical protein